MARLSTAVEPYFLGAAVWIGYTGAMSLALKTLAQFAIKKLASNPEARQKAVDVARTVAQEAKQINAQDDKARAAGKAFSKALRSLKDGTEPPPAR